MAQQTQLDAAYRAQLLALPSEKIIAERMTAVNPVGLCLARHALERAIGMAMKSLWETVFYACNNTHAFEPTAEQAGLRSLKNLALHYLLASKDTSAIALATTQFEQASNMTDRIAALSCLLHFAPKELSQPAAMQFYQRHEHDPLAIDKWFTLQASARQTQLADILALQQHPAFTLRTPNRARALIFQFCSNNTLGMHQQAGSSYAYWADQVLALDKLNPEIAARLCRVLDNWARFNEPYRSGMQAQLIRINQESNVSRNVREIISKSLALTA